MRAIDIAATSLVVIGALNWGLVGLFNFNLVTALLGQTIFATIVFSLVGAAAVYFIGRWAAAQKRLGVVPA